MAAVTARAASAGADGIGSLSGIPGTVGGSLRMNAGTDREMGDFVRDVWVQSPAKPEPHAVTVRYFYRHSTLARDAIVSRVTLAFRLAEAGGVRREMKNRLSAGKIPSPSICPTPASVSAIRRATKRRA